MVAAAITVGAVAKRGPLVPAMVWTFLWATPVYCPIACWPWNAAGWGFMYGVMDYASEGPVGPRQARRENDTEFPSARLLHPARDRAPLVQVVRFQQWIVLRRQPQSNNGLAGALAWRATSLRYRGTFSTSGLLGNGPCGLVFRDDLWTQSFWALSAALYVTLLPKVSPLSFQRTRPRH